MQSGSLATLLTKFFQTFLFWPSTTRMKASYANRACLRLAAMDGYVDTCFDHQPEIRDVEVEARSGLGGWKQKLEAIYA